MTPTKRMNINGLACVSTVQRLEKIQLQHALGYIAAVEFECIRRRMLTTYATYREYPSNIQYIPIASYISRDQLELHWWNNKILLPDT